VKRNFGLYGERWRKSSLIEDAYEAEVFFPKLGDGADGAGLPPRRLKTSDGTVVGAIETLWDTTENKRRKRKAAVTSRSWRRTEQALSQIIQGSTTPTFVINRNHIVTHWNRALEKLTGYAAE
jgi:hypothetical protein